MDQIKAEMSFTPAIELFSQFYDVVWFDYRQLLKLKLNTGSRGNSSELEKLWTEHQFVFVYGKWCGDLDHFIRNEVSLASM